MRVRLLAVLGVTMVCGLAGVGAAQGSGHLNPVIDLLQAKKPVFGLYAPANRGGGRGRGATPDTTPPKTPAQLAQEALAYKSADLIFSGAMEGNFDRGYPGFVEFAKAMSAAGMVQKSPSMRLTHPLFVKTPVIRDDPAVAADRIAKQLNTGVAGVVFVEIETAEELKAGLAAMRFKSKGGTRPDDVGDAPAIWGMSESDYRNKADLWPLNPNGELVNWTIVETEKGIENIREIAAVKGIGALFPGSGTLRSVYRTADGATDEVRWEAAIQKVLAACKEFNVPCGFPPTEANIEMRMKQGFSVFIINWGDAGFRAVDVGRRAAGQGAAR